MCECMWKGEIYDGRDLQWDPVVYYVNHIKLLIVLSDTCVTFFLTNNVIFNKNILNIMRLIIKLYMLIFLDMMISYSIPDSF